ncbi:hypothetical protein AB0P41_11700 [Streptomyces sp. NPDC079167]|uniref:VMAP-C domain-containing protein n=1 Tax=Streptomyces sp. NPDC079167 TaxID=3154513 RepID=UPI0034200EAC
MGGELWSVGPARRPLGHHHPVVVRSLERYIDAWLDPEPWRERWQALHAEGPDGNALDKIGWPSLHFDKAEELIRWLIEHPDMACVGLTVSHDRLEPPVRDAIDDAIFTEGLPAMLWRRDGGDSADLLEALREHSPNNLAELPDTVRRVRRSGRVSEQADVRNNIVLLWDDPYCVDLDQDSPFPGLT